MTAKHWLTVLSLAILAGSCGQNSTKKTETGTDSVTNTPNSVDTSTGLSTTTTPVTTSITVPEQVKSSFQKKYPDVRDVSWSRYEPVSTFDWDWTGWPVMDTADYVARFNYNNHDYWAWFDSEYNWVGAVATVSDFNGLPAAVNKVISRDYAGYTIETVDQEFDKNRTAYEIDMVKGQDKMKLLIDENGKIMKKKAVTDGERTKDKL